MNYYNKIKGIIFIISITFFSLSAYSQNITYKKDWQGNNIAVDNMGNTIATQKKDWQGNLIWVDNQGNTIKTQKKDWQGNTIWVDPQGNIINTQKQDWQGNKIIVNTDGQTEYVYKKDWQGNDAVYDTKGNLVGTYKKDWQGNTVFVGESNFTKSIPEYKPNISQSPPKFTPYVPQNPIITLTPEERAAYYAAKARREQATIQSIVTILDYFLTVTPEDRAQQYKNQYERQKRNEERQERNEKLKAQRKTERIIIFGSETYNKCKMSRNIWFGSALASVAIGTATYLGSNSSYKQYQTATTDAVSKYNQAALYNKISPIAFGLVGLCTLEFILKTNRLSKSKKEQTSINLFPLKNGSGLSFAYKF